MKVLDTYSVVNGINCPYSNNYIRVHLLSLFHFTLFFGYLVGQLASLSCRHLCESLSLVVIVTKNNNVTTYSWAQITFISSGLFKFTSHVLLNERIVVRVEMGHLNCSGRAFLIYGLTCSSLLEPFLSSDRKSYAQIKLEFISFPSSWSICCVFFSHTSDDSGLKLNTTPNVNNESP